MRKQKKSRRTVPVKVVIDLAACLRAVALFVYLIF